MSLKRLAVEDLFVQPLRSVQAVEDIDTFQSSRIEPTAYHCGPFQSFQTFNPPDRVRGPFKTFNGRNEALGLENNHLLGGKC
jgi:hypothetical protein